MKRKISLGSVIGKMLTIIVLILTLASPGWPQSAPDFALKDVIHSQEYTLGQFKGKVVLINFITFLCGPCREEMPLLNQLDKELKNQGFQTLGIALASESAQIRSLTQQLGLEYPMLMGSDQVSKAYGNVDLVPTTFIIDRQGKIAHKILGARSKEDFAKLIRPLL